MVCPCALRTLKAIGIAITSAVDLEGCRIALPQAHGASLHTMPNETKEMPQVGQGIGKGLARDWQASCKHKDLPLPALAHGQAGGGRALCATS